MGLESPHSAYAKLKGADTLALTARTAAARHQAAGLDHRRAGAPHAGEHRRRDRARRGARHRFPPVHAVHAGARHAAVRRDEGAGAHAARRRPGRHPRAAQFNFEHAAISREESKQFLDWAFRRDFERNGPSLYRICRTTLEGWQRYKNDADARVRARFAWEARALNDGYAAALVGDGKAPARAPTRRSAQRFARCARKWPRVRPAQPRDSRACRPGAALVRAARREAASPRARPTSRDTIIERRNWQAIRRRQSRQSYDDHCWSNRTFR